MTMFYSSLLLHESEKNAINEDFITSWQQKNKKGDQYGLQFKH